MEIPKRFIKAGNLGYPEEEIIEKQVLKDGTFVKKVAQTVIVDHKTQGRRVESLTIDEFRKVKKNEPWPESATSRISLDHDAVRNLLNYLLAHKEFLKLQRSSFCTLLTGTHELSELNPSELSALVSLVQVAAKQGKLAEIIKPEALQNFNAAIHQARYKSAIDQLSQMLSNAALSEDSYKKWFLEHHWVFGTDYLGPEGGTKIGWAVKGDIILRSIDGYQDLVELKLPTAEVLKHDPSHKNWFPYTELSKALAQVIKYFQETEDARMILAQKEKLPFLKPRARIVIGRSNAWEQEQYDALRRLNASLQNIQIMSYDYLLSIAKRMIEYYEKAV